MDCSCDINVDYDGSAPEFCEEKIVKARKKHTCGECRRAIQPGEDYEKVTGKWDGDFASYKTCSDCISIRKQFFNSGWLYGEIIWLLRDEIGERDGALPQECLAALTPDARNKVCDMIQEHWEEREDNGYYD